MTYKYTDDDYCDIYENRICDNCGKCLEIEGIDTRAIRIEDIAKSREENDVLEQEFLDDLKSSLSEDELKELEEDNLDLKAIYSKFGDKLGLYNNTDYPEDDSEYEDAFDHIEYLNDSALFSNENIDELTEEVYPGVRKLKKPLEDI